MRLSQFIPMIATPVMVVAFQNCGQGEFTVNQESFKPPTVVANEGTVDHLPPQGTEPLPPVVPASPTPRPSTPTPTPVPPTPPPSPTATPPPSQTAACGSVPHGTVESRVRYQATNLSEGSSCNPQTQTRTCMNGSFSSWSGSYTQISCTVTRVRYQAASVTVAPCVQQSQIMTCSNGACGTFTPNTYTYASCVVSNGSSNTNNGIAHIPLQITNIKPAGTGVLETPLSNSPGSPLSSSTPAIPSTNRIFRAYPGIEYNIRAAVIGGVYPYTYSLSNAPSGMTINSRTGEIIWPNPQANASGIQLRVTDSRNVSVSTSWSITVNATGFVFVNAAYTGATESGSFSQPYKSLRSFLTATTGRTTDIVYFRAGTYQMVHHNAQNTTRMNLDSNSRTWLGYPGDTVIIEGLQTSTGGDGRAWGIAAFGDFYFDRLQFRNMRDYGIITAGNVNYKTIRRCLFDNIYTTNPTNNNYGIIHTTNDGPGYYFVIQDSEFRNYRNVSAIGSLYNDKKMLIENNYIHGSLESDSDVHVAIAAKYYTDYLTVRGNRVDITDGAVFSYYMNAATWEARHVEILYNFFRNRYIDPETDRVEYRDVHSWNSHGESRETYYHRNTAVGVNNFRFNPCGQAQRPFHFYDNVFVSDRYELDDFSCQEIQLDNNVYGTPANNVIDENGNLTSAYSRYIGTNGYQLP